MSEEEKLLMERERLAKRAAELIVGLELGKYDNNIKKGLNKLKKKK